MALKNSNDLAKKVYYSKDYKTATYLKSFVVFALDKVCARLLAGNEEFMTILDLQGYGYSNSDARGYIGVLSILQSIDKLLPRPCGLVAPGCTSLWKGVGSSLSEDNIRVLQ
nr:random slug protein 5-like isoform X1 [Ipomoea batatas]